MFKCLLLVTLLLPLLPVECLFVGDNCVANDGSGQCMLLSQCQPLLAEVRTAGTPMPILLRRKLQTLACGFQREEPLVCCASDEDLTNMNGGIDIPSGTSVHGMGVTCAEGHSCDDDSNTNNGVVTNEVQSNLKNHRNFRLLPTDCGVIESDRIWGGNRTRLFEMPWMVLISYDSARGTKLSCGGTLINEWYVLTAAHCVSFLGSRLTPTAIVVGEYDVRKDPDCERVEGELHCAPSVRNISIETITAHTGYSPQNLVDDIALIRLSQPADFSLDNMKPICLPTTPELQSDQLVGRQGVVAGWGATEDGLQSPVLLSVELPIVSNQDCQAAYNGNPRIYERQICAGGVPDKDSCGGDSGGPLMYPGTVGSRGLRYVQRGIVSYGSKRCGLGGYPGVYTRVANYMDWILDNIR